MRKLLYFCFVFSLFICYVQNADIVINYLGTPLDFNDAATWTGKVLPGRNDSAQISSASAAGAVCYATQSILVGILYVGGSIADSSLKGTLNTSSSITALTAMAIGNGSVLNLQPNAAGIQQISPTLFRSYGNLNLLPGAKYQWNGDCISQIGHLVLQSSSLLNVTGLVGLNGSDASISGGSTLISNNLYLLNGQLTLNASNLLNNGEVQIVENSTLTILDSTLTALKTNESQVLSIMNNSKAYFTNSFLNITEVSLYARDTAQVHVQNSQILSTNAIAFVGQNQSSFLVSDNSDLEIPLVLLFDNSSINVDGSKIVVAKELLMANTTVLKLTSSTFKSGSWFGAYNYSQVSVIGTSFSTVNASVFSDSSFLWVDNSNVTVNDNCVFWNSATLVAKASNITIDGSWGALGTSQVSVNTSTIYILYSTLFGNSTQFSIDNSDMYVKDTIQFWGTSSMVLTNSNITLDGSHLSCNYSRFSMENSELLIKEALYFTNSSQFVIKKSNITVEGHFDIVFQDDIQTSQIQDSNIQISGFFLNYGDLEITDSQIETSSNFATLHSLKTTNSAITVEDGFFATYVNYTGTNTTISMNNGQIQVYLYSNFVCVNCEINLHGGHFQQDFGSTISLVNTTVVNGGNLGSYGGLTINGNYTQSSQGQLTLSFDAPSNKTLVSVDQIAVFNGTLTVRINENLLQTGQPASNQTLMTYTNSTGAFSKAVIITYNRDTGEETVIISDCQKVKIETTDSKFGVLIDPSLDSDSCPKDESILSSKSKLSKGAIAGIVCGIVGGAVLITVVIVVAAKRRIIMADLKSKFNKL